MESRAVDANSCAHAACTPPVELVTSAAPLPTYAHSMHCAIRRGLAVRHLLRTQILKPAEKKQKFMYAGGAGRP